MRRGGSRITSTGTSRTATGVRYPASQMPTLADIHGAGDTIGHLYERYYNAVGFLVPVIQHDWQAVFREPWMRQTGR